MWLRVLVQWCFRLPQVGDEKSERLKTWKTSLVFVKEKLSFWLVCLYLVFRIRKGWKIPHPKGWKMPTQIWDLQLLFFYPLEIFKSLIENNYWKSWGGGHFTFLSLKSIPWGHKFTHGGLNLTPGRLIKTPRVPDSTPRGLNSTIKAKFAFEKPKMTSIARKLILRGSNRLPEVKKSTPSTIWVKNILSKSTNWLPEV